MDGGGTYKERQYRGMHQKNIMGNRCMVVAVSIKTRYHIAALANEMKIIPSFYLLSDVLFRLTELRPCLIVRAFKASFEKNSTRCQ